MFANTLLSVLMVASRECPGAEDSVRQHSTLVAQKPFAETYRPGHWQPAIRVSPKTPLSLALTNRTKTDISYSFLDGRAAERKIAPGDRVQINKVALPLDLAVFNSVRTEIINTGIKYDLVYKPSNNELQVTVAPASNSDSTTINVDKTGGVYLY